MFEKLIIEVPHRLTVKSWNPISDDEIIDYAFQEGMHYQAWTADDAVRDWGSNVPDELAALLVSNAVVIEAGYLDSTHFYAESDAPTQLETAIETLGHDLHTIRVIDRTVDSLKEELSQYKNSGRHQRNRIIRILEDELEELLRDEDADA